MNVSRNVLKKIVKMILTKNILSKLPQDSTDIYKRNIVIRYIIKPEEATLLCILYQLRAKLIEKESQPRIIY